ncbi:polymorphic toxin-type HINT domain-containing protein [Micromonospora mirobrigensis]|uniref:Intein C-terminal splicing region/RHS repeat-associated core domain-containing protein n=1 Tax=Micromonospora mirobrigensis TaxID=262898 RepID=A0A1C4ZZL0_9ACTN|nr:polymorphic toxin-type HINT domain-containing protein [Micromonospora mirobrigensis]SCF38194.1 intein C-terminal splicing region/RHS repeat-associated core domain-containing protein [Micromonospora mirobrigensis]
MNPTRLRTVLAATVSLSLAASVLSVPTRAAAEPKPHLAVQQEKIDADGAPAKGRAWPVRAVPSAQLAAPVWPKAGRAAVSLPAAPAGQRQSAPSAVRAGTLPVSVSRGAGAAGDRTDAVSVEVLDRAAVPTRWRNGLLVRLAGSGAATTKTAAPAAAGSTTVSVDYRDFKNAYGGSWSSRLRLWRLPECALVTPDRAECAAAPLDSRNQGGAVSAEVPLPAPGAGDRTAVGASTLVALAAGASGSEGDFSASPLGASATWSGGGSTGDFSWSYPLQAPPPIGGPSPSLALSYSSSAVDGKSDASNNQPSWVGEGFDYWSGYIERSYVGCADDMTGGTNTRKTGDQCWRSDNATMMLNGRGTELVYEAGKGWHGRSEDGSKIEKLAGAGNGDNDGEYWKVTTTDGMQYFFGRHSLPGQSGTTDSTWTVPVSGNQSGEPCYNTSFASSFCDQAWRWNLDYVVDPRGNTMSYWYTPEGNYYGRNLTSTSKARYDRGGTLKRIDYGTWDRGTTDRSVTPTAQVLFTVADRCEANCSIHDAAHWKDVPWDQECIGTAASCTNYSPTFWSTKRLSKITTQVWDTTKATPAWQAVDSWTLTHTYPAVGDGSDYAGMWLSSIVRAGHVGSTLTMPPVTFTPVALRNRVLTRNNTTNNRMRMGNIVTETGAKIQVTYSLPDCPSGISPAANTRRCYPVIGPDPYDPDGPDITEWWHKYVVTQVSESDLMVVVNGTDRGQPVKNTFYTYVGAPAWHYADDNGLVKPKRKTWNQFRGYATVETRVGDAPSQTLTRTTYLRGMHGDRVATSGGTRTVTVPASLGSETVYDEDQFAGMVREQVTYNGVDTRPVAKTVNVPWMSPALATRNINGDIVTARYTDTKATYSGTALGVNGASGWRVTRTQSTFDNAYGTVTQVQDDGDTAKTGDEQCATYSYNRNTALNLLTVVKQTTVTALACGSAPQTTDDVISDERTYYDGATSVDTAPTAGAATQVERLKSWTKAGGTTWQVVTKGTYDMFGRPRSATDVRGNVTTTTYTPASGGPLQKVTTTSPDPNGGTAWSSTVESEPYRGGPTRTTDRNGRVSEQEYDPLGRLARVWQAGWAKSTHPTSPSIEYGYVFAPNRDAYPYTTTRTLHAGGGYLVSYSIQDALFRPRQTQTVAVGGGRVVTDTLYDKAGRAVTSYSPHVEPGAAAGGLWWEPEWSVPSLTRTVYDDAGRATASIYFGTDGVTNLVEKWRTNTEYFGDSVKVTPPAKDVPTTTVTDAHGRTVQVRQHVSPEHSTSYVYDRRGQLVTVRDTAGDEWTYTYDVRGRQLTSVDPDKGKLTNVYNDFSELTQTIDANGKVLVYDYDKIGRKIGLYDTSKSAATKRAEWKYDKLFTGQPLLGVLGQATRYDPPGSTNAYTVQPTGFTPRYQPTGMQYVIPAAEGTGLAGTWSYGFGYSPYEGSPTSVTLPAVGNLTTETLTTNYDSVTGLPTSLDTNLINVGRYVIGQQYSAYGEPTINTRKTNGGVYVEQAFDYDLTTHRVNRSRVQPETATGTVKDVNYGYDDAGNITSIADTPAVGQADTQCFRYDDLRRLTSAWTPKSGVACGTDPSTANLGGPAPYWQDWTIDALGNRTKETSHASTGDTTRTYALPTPGQGVARPHAATSVTVAEPGKSPVTNRYDYDKAGNTVCRPAGAPANACPPDASSQLLSWDSEGRLTSVSGSSGGSNIYDADGSRLIHRDATGSTLYLPGQEVRTASGLTSATRYYQFAGSTVASRSGGLTWLFNDHQGTQNVAVDALTQAVTVRRQTPYGVPRGQQPTWTNLKGFVGGDKDTTGLTHIGAREYDPGLGRFVSVDPVQDLTDPQQWNAYAYGNNSPITFSDPDGLKACSDDACGPGADYEDMYGKYVDVSGHNDGCNGCSKTEDPYAEKKPPTINDKLGSHVPLSKTHKTIVKAKSYKGTEQFTWKEMLDWAAQDQTNWVFLCSEVMGGDPLVCDVQNPLLPQLSKLEDLVQMAVILGGVTCALIGPACLAEAALAEGEFAATGAVLTSGGAGANLLRGMIGREAVGAEKVVNSFCSFGGDTRVLMADGTTKPISELKVGDEVEATDPETGEQGDRRVTNLWIHEDDLGVLRVDGEILETTDGHPFWNVTDHKWEAAGDLRPGDRLVTSRGDTVLVDRPLSAPSHRGLAYNLTVDGIHTYYVIAGTTSVLVHNTGSLPCVSNRISWQKQGRHVLGDPLHDNTGKGYLNSHSDAQRVLDAYHSGEATVLGQMENGNIVVRYGNVTGYNNNPAAGFVDQPTNVFMIKGTKSPSVVPINPNWTPRG